jgi:hypothetical protein
MIARTIGPMMRMPTIPVPPRAADMLPPFLLPQDSGPMSPRLNRDLRTFGQYPYQYRVAGVGVSLDHAHTADR